MRSVVLPMLVFSDPGLLGFFFIATLVLYEKEARSLQAISVTPLRPREYLWAKAVSLSTLAVLASIAVAAFGGEIGLHLLLLVPAVGLCGLLVVFAGFSLVSRAKTFSHFLLQAIPVLMIISIPFVDIAGLYRSPLFYLFPSYPPMAAIWYALRGGNTVLLLASTLLTVLWVYVFYRLALSSHTRYIVGRG